MIVSDAGPLIAFSKINLIEVLAKLFGKIVIPRSVQEECSFSKANTDALEIQNNIEKGVIEVRNFSVPNLQNKDFESLDRGEAHAIKLAMILNEKLLIDEKLGRNVAKKLKLKVIGTCAVLVFAKEKKLIKKVSPFLQKLKDTGYFLSNGLIQKILTDAKENYTVQ